MVNLLSFITLKKKKKDNTTEINSLINRLQTENLFSENKIELLENRLKELSNSLKILDQVQKENTMLVEENTKQKKENKMLKEEINIFNKIIEGTKVKRI